MNGMKKFLLYLLFVSAASLLLAGISHAEQFSADVSMRSPDGSHRGRIYVSDRNVRMEMPEATTITRVDKGVVWILMASEKMYLEQPMDIKSAIATSTKADGEISREKLGTERVGGRQATKYRVTYSQGAGTNTVDQWIDDTLQIPIKTAAVDGTWSMEFSNISNARQPDNLFEMPAGYKRFTVPSMSDIMASAQNNR